MRIHDVQPVQRVNPYLKQHVSARQTDKQTQQRKTDEVSISDEALRMAQQSDLSETAANPSRTNRAERLQQIKQSIQNGTYQAPVQEIAQKIYDAFAKQADK
jgi:flagellar biosynthesis anti-sigma factor FlgM